MNEVSDWRAGLIVDPATGQSVAGQWPLLSTAAGVAIRIDEHGIVHGTVSDTPAHRFHQEETKGAFLRALARQPYQQAYWEGPYYDRILDGFLPGDLTEVTALDLGCGDGRFTEYLLNRGANRIVCVDFDHRLLVSLAEFLRERGDEDRVLLMHADVLDLPLRTRAFDLILTIGVLYYLNEKYEEALRTLRMLLRDNGQLITSDPDIEGFLLRSLVFDSLEEALRTFESHRFKEVREPTNSRFRAFDDSESATLFDAAGFAVLERRGISMFHNLLRVLELRGAISRDAIAANEDRIRSMLDYLHERGRLPKHVVWKLQRQGS